MSRTRAWSLLEVMVVSGLAAVIVLVVSLTLASTSRLTNLEAQRGYMQGQLQTLLTRFESTLQRSCAAGVTWLPPAPGQSAVLAIHPLQSDSITNSPHWEAAWICFLWDQPRGKLMLRTCPPGPPALAPPRTDRPQPPTPAQLAQLGSTPPSTSQLLSQTVSHLEYHLEVGPLARVIVELEVKVPQRVQTEKLRIERSFYFRNRI